MAEDLVRDLFRNRQRWIRDADIAVAAALYLKAGLGLLAKQRYANASLYWSLVGDRERAKLNQDRWAAVSTYWEDDADAAQSFDAPYDSPEGGS